jgi:hypothetical protein
MPNNIADRAEAGEDAAVLLDELWQLLRGPTYTTDSKQRVELSNFLALLDINTPEAHLAAAMMLLDEKWGFQIMPLYCVLKHPNSGCQDSEKDVHASGTSPAHALIAAIARSQADGR